MSFENLILDKVVLHRVFKRNDEHQRIAPVYGTSLVPFAPRASQAICTRINTALGTAAKCIELDIIDNTQGSLVELSSRLVNSDRDLFIHHAREAADKLTDAQNPRNTPGGVLMVFSGTAGNPAKRFIGYLKAQIHDGFAESEDENGQAIITYIEKLILSPEAKLYKIGMFVETLPDAPGALPDGWTAFVFDASLTITNKSSAADFFYEGFMGCRFQETSAQRTQEFYKYTKEFIQTRDLPEEHKSDLHNALVTYLKTDLSPTLQVTDFSQRYLPGSQMRDEYSEYMKNKSFPVSAISKDLTCVAPALRVRKLVFPGNIRFTAPADAFADTITIRVINADGDEEGARSGWTEIIVRDRIREQE